MKNNQTNQKLLAEIERLKKELKKKKSNRIIIFFSINVSFYNIRSYLI